MKLYKFMDPIYGQLNLINRRLKISRYAELNDPFELRPLDAKNKAIRTKLANWIKYEMNPNFGIISLSGSWKNPVLWSHYAQNHTGICLELEVPNNYAKKMDYQPELLFPGLNETNLDEFLSPKFATKLTTTKFIHWEYEDESRMHFSLNKLDEYQFTEGDMHFCKIGMPGEGNPIILTGVIVGCRSSITRTEIDNCLGIASEAVKRFRVRPRFGRFEMYENQDPTKWP